MLRVIKYFTKQLWSLNVIEMTPLSHQSELVGDVAVPVSVRQSVLF